MSAALTTKLNKPNVSRVIGRVRIKRIGLITALTIPRTKATIRAVIKLSTSKPGT